MQHPDCAPIQPQVLRVQVCRPSQLASVAQEDIYYLNLLLNRLHTRAAQVLGRVLPGEFRALSDPLVETVHVLVHGYFQVEQFIVELPSVARN